MFDFGFHDWYNPKQLKCRGLIHFGNRLEKLENLYFIPITNPDGDQLRILCEKCSKTESTNRINVQQTYTFAISWFKQFELHYLGYLTNNTLLTKKSENQIQQREFQEKLLLLSSCINDLNHNKVESFLQTVWNSKMIQNKIIDQSYEQQAFLAYVKQQSNQLFALASRHFYNIFLKADAKLKSQDDNDIVQIEVSKDFVFLLEKESSFLVSKQLIISVYLYPSLEYVDSFNHEIQNIKDFVMKSSVQSNLLVFQHKNQLKVSEIFVKTGKKDDYKLKFLLNYQYRHNCEIIDSILEENRLVFIDQTYKLFVVNPQKKEVQFLTKKLQALQRTNQKLVALFHFYKELLIIELCNKVLTMSLQNCKFKKSSQIAEEKTLAVSYLCKPNKIKYSVLQKYQNTEGIIKNEIVAYSFQCNKQLRRVNLRNSTELGNIKLSLKKDLKTLILLSNEYVSVYDMQKGVLVFCLPFAQKFNANNYDFQGYCLVQNQESRALIWKQEKLFERDIRLFFKRL
ncbi:unnamed protein product (macronuclear) [Paramecium tetraurelia]|uniref:Uncharacterized protein n=1 Tax=Paramecium tetraurelia TaxID=5888 RepID=A0DLN7_PARTE|nr:uncharacterized protein GSPATT00039586001 [Paramecium tetraurelia]CAK83954.1 unnamed protein product [Paramecium tetraurelia]|eukprot:XP_001451351.1 hypothetical protein (macronuclear) [Paramecium tetraurelia strain d4-2]